MIKSSKSFRCELNWFVVWLINLFFCFFGDQTLKVFFCVGDRTHLLLLMTDSLLSSGCKLITWTSVCGLQGIHPYRGLLLLRGAIFKTCFEVRRLCIGPSQSAVASLLVGPVRWIIIHEKFPTHLIYHTSSSWQASVAIQDYRNLDS